MKKSISLILILILAFPLFFAACMHRKESPENFYFGTYSEAEQLYSRAEYEKAIQRYQAYIDENPEGNLAVISQYYIAKSYAALGNIEEAKSRFEKIRADHPDLVWANFSDTQLKELQEKPAAVVTKK